MTLRPPAIPKFLIVDDNSDSRFLLVKTLLRKFPRAVVQECQQSEPALQLAQTESLSAVVAHRATDVDGLTLIRLLRRVNPVVPMVMVSGYDRSKEALAAGANRFLNYDEWLRIGTIVAELLGSDTVTASPFPGADPARSGASS